MPPPSTVLLQAIRATEYIQSSLPLSLARQVQPRCRCSSSLSRCHVRLLPKKSRSIRPFSSKSIRRLAAAPKYTERGPASQEDTRTDFGILDVLANSPPPSTAIDACLSDGFHLDNGVKITGGSGCLLVDGEAFSWRPWLAGSRPGGTARGRMINKKGQWDVEKEAWGLLELVWPKPDLLILGLGTSMHPISPETRKYINSLGIRIEVQDTRNAAAQFNLLATERGVGDVAAALIPIGWKEPIKLQNFG